MIYSYFRQLWYSMGSSAARVNPVDPVVSFRDEKPKRLPEDHMVDVKKIPAEISGSVGSGIGINLSIWV